MILPFEVVFEDQTKLGTKVQTSEYRETGAHIIVDQGQEQIAGYTDREEGIFTAVPAIIFGDHTRIIKYVDQPFFLGADGVKVLRCKKAHANYRYLYYALRHARIPDTGYNRHYKWLKEIDIEYPDASRQEEIVTILDGVCNIIAERQRQLRILDQLIKARFVEMFGEYQDTVQLSDVAEVTGGLTKNGNRDRLPFKMPYLRVANVSFASIDTTEMFSIGLTEEERLKTTLQYGDLLFVEGNGSPDQIGRVAIWRDEVVPCVHQNHIIKARLNESKMLPAFAMHYFMSQKGRDQIKKKAVSTSGLYTLSVSKISGFVMPCPPISKQSEFAVLVGQVDKSKLSIQASLDHLETLKQSLMQKYYG